jgi:hypothetical protein
LKWCGDRMEQQQPINIAIFEFEVDGQIQTCESSTFVKKEEAILHAWKALQRKGIDGNQVRQIYSEWRPSPDVEEFIKGKCPYAAFTYSFEDGDEEKFEKAKKKR